MATASTTTRSTAPATSADQAPDRLSVWIPASAFTLAGFRAWATSGTIPEQVRAAFVGEEIHLDMSNEEPEAHVGVKTEVSRVLATLNRELRLGKYYANGVLVSNEAAQVSNNPDGSFLSHKSLRAGRARLVPREGQQGRYAEIEGTPDWVMEVISDSSVEKDTDRLRAAYHRAGIAEYWLIDARGEEIAFQVLSWRSTGYVAARPRRGWVRSRVFGRAFRLVRERDESGLWLYTLEVQP